MTAAADGVCAVVICRNEAGYIEGCLDALEAGAEDGGGFEIVVVDGGSADGTAERARQWAAARPGRPPVRVVEDAAPGYAPQRNRGAQLARYPWIAFVSADVRVPLGWLGRVRAVLGEAVELGVGRFDLVPDADRGGWMGPLARTLYPSRVPAHEWVERCSTVHLLVRRSALLAHPFDERLGGCEDKDLAYRLSHAPDWTGAVGLEPRPAHLAREGFGAFVRKLYRESRDLRLLRHAHGPGFPDCFGWRRHAAEAGAVFAAGLAGAGAAAAAGWPAPVCAALPLAAGVGAAGWYPAGWRRRPRGVRPAALLPLHLAAMCAVTAGQLAGLARDLIPAPAAAPAPRR